MTLDEITKKLASLPDVHRDIGVQLAGVLVCELCRRTLHCPAEKAAEYLRSGWPSCCGYTMTLATERAQGR